MELTGTDAVQPRCRHFGTCGGCQTQHLAYSRQLENKRQRLAYLFANSLAGDIEVFASEPYGYRSRMDFLCTSAGPAVRGERGGTLAVRECPIADPRMQTIIDELHVWWAKHPELEPFEPRRQSGVLKYAVVRCAREVAVSFMLSEGSPAIARTLEAIQAFADATSAAHVVVAYSPPGTDDSLSLEYHTVKGDEFLVEDFLGIPLTYHVEAFFQNNPRVAEAMVGWVRDELIARGCEGKTVVDGYGGVGTFGFALARHCAKVISVESHPLAAPCVARTKAASGINNIDAVTMDAAAMHKLTVPADALYIVDPPRSGMDPKVIRYLVQAAPRVIAYISCNPAQFAKELVTLGQRYTVERLALFDMFPQTNHIECAAILVRRD